MRVRVTFGALALVGANDGLDPEVCAERYAEALRGALAREWPEAEVAVEWSYDRAATIAEVSGIDDESAEHAHARIALDLAWAIKGTADWAS